MQQKSGGILGLAVGDALGVPVEFLRREFLDGNPVTGMRGYGTYHQPPGTWSDDTSMTLGLLDAMDGGELDLKRVMQNFANWLYQADYTAHGSVFDVGSTTSLAINRFRRGLPLDECGLGEETDNGNGSLMRTLPLVFYARERGQRVVEIIELIHQVSALTHAHPISQMACGIYCFVAEQLLTHDHLQQAVAQGLADAAAYYAHDQRFLHHLPTFAQVLDQDLVNTDRRKISGSGYTVHCLTAAIWCLITTDNYRDCVLRAVNLGEDTDTTAAVAGGLAGTFYGVAGIPEDWLAQLARREEIEALCSTRR